MTQQLARVFENGIARHPEDWHMLQKVFVADLDTRQAAPRWPATAARPVAAPRFTSERTSSLLWKAVHGALAVIHLRWSARSPACRAFAPGVAVNTCPVAPGRAG
jgi:hypothetical protein